MGEVFEGKWRGKGRIVWAEEAVRAGEKAARSGGEKSVNRVEKEWCYRVKEVAVGEGLAGMNGDKKGAREVEMRRRAGRDQCASSPIFPVQRKSKVTTLPGASEASKS